MKESSQIQVQNLDHLGLVAGIIDEIGVVEQINQLVGQHCCEKVSPGAKLTNTNSSKNYRSQKKKPKRS